MPMRPPRLLETRELLEYAVKLLAGRACSTGEMREKLRRKAARAEDVDAVMAQLKEHGYLDDARFAESYASARLETQGFGSGRVLRDLRGRRVVPAVAERTVRELYAKVDEEALVEEFLRRKLRGKGAVLEEEKDVAAAWRKLQRAGFAPGVALRVLKRFAANPALLDGFEPAEEAGEE